MGRIKRNCAFEHCAKCAESDHPVHAQIWVFALHSYILSCPMIPLVDAQADLGLCCPHIPEARRHVFACRGLCKPVKSYWCIQSILICRICDAKHCRVKRRSNVLHGHAEAEASQTPHPSTVSRVQTSAYFYLICVYVFFSVVQTYLSKYFTSSHKIITSVLF